MFRRCLPVFLVVLAGALFISVDAQTADALKADLIKDWGGQKERMIALADAMPPEKYEFKATKEQRTFGEQLHHLAQAHVKTLSSLDSGKRLAMPTIGPSHTKPDVMKVLGEAYDYGTAVLQAQQEPLAAAAGERVRARVVWQAMGNAMNHYGQCVVYLRLNGIVPPASRR